MYWLNYQECKTGHKHFTKGKGCEDNTASKSLDGYFAIALCDGLSSAKYSGIGSKVVSQLLVDCLISNRVAIARSKRSDKTVSLIQKSFDESISKTMRKHHCEAKDLASTMIFALVTPCSMAIGKLGDGYVAYHTKKNNRIILEEVKESYEELTHSTATPNAFSYLEIVKVGKKQSSKIKAITMTSDGMDALVEKDDGKVRFKQHMNDLISLLTRKDKKEFYSYKDEIFNRLIGSHLQEGFDGLTKDDCSINILARSRYPFGKYFALSKKDKLELAAKYVSREKNKIRLVQDIHLIMSFLGNTECSYAYLLTKTKLSGFRLDKVLHILKKDGLINMSKNAVSLAQEEPNV